MSRISIACSCTALGLCLMWSSLPNFLSSVHCWILSNVENDGAACACGILPKSASLRMPQARYNGCEKTACNGTRQGLIINQDILVKLELEICRVCFLLLSTHSMSTSSFPNLSYITYVPFFITDSRSNWILWLLYRLNLALSEVPLLSVNELTRF